MRWLFNGHLLLRRLKLWHEFIFFLIIIQEVRHFPLRRLELYRWRLIFEAISVIVFVFLFFNFKQSFLLFNWFLRLAK